MFSLLHFVNTCRQNDMSALDYIQKPQDIADIVGDLDNLDVVRAFFHHAKTYLCAELAKMGLQASDLSTSELKDQVVSLEWAYEIAENEKRKSSKV